jgi:hypothetical protein
LALEDAPDALDVSHLAESASEVSRFTFRITE